MIVEINAHSELPNGWVQANLGDVVKIRNGFAFKSTDYLEDGVLLIRQTNLRYKTINLEGAVYLPKDYAHKYKDFIVANGDILVGMSGSIGSLCVYDLDTPALQNQRTGLMIFYNPEVKSYVRYFFETLKEYLINMAKGVAVQNVSALEIESCSMPLPPLPEQHRIVSKIEELFTKLDAGVDALKKVKDELKHYRQSVLKHAFEGKLTAGWREANKGQIEPASVLLERMKEERKKALGGKYKELPTVDISDLPELPEGWAWTRIGDISEIIRGASPRPAGDPKYFGGDIPWITVGEITKDSKMHLASVSNFVTKAGMEKSRYIESGTFLLTNSGATLGVPKITLISGCINDGSVAMLGLDETLKKYLYYFLTSKTASLRRINQGAAQPNLNTTIVSKIEFPLPPTDEQTVVVKEIEQHFSLGDKIEIDIENSIKQSQRLRQSILKKAFEGKLVPQDPTDEPAEKLLERIKVEQEKRANESKWTKKITKKGRKKKGAV